MKLHEFITITESILDMNKVYFATYNDLTDFITVYVGEKLKFVLNCTRLNNAYFEDSLVISYLHRLAREEPLIISTSPYSLTGCKGMLR